MRSFLFLLVAAIIAGCASTGPKSSEAVKWHSLEEGRKLARLEGKPMIVDFYTMHECPRCRIMDQTYKDPVIASRLNSEFIPIRVELSRALTDEEHELGKKYDYNFDCLLLFLDSEGNILEDSFGKRMCFTRDLDPEWFNRYLDTVSEKTRK